MGKRDDHAWLEDNWDRLIADPDTVLKLLRLFQIVCAHTQPAAYHQVEELWLTTNSAYPKCVAGVVYKWRGQDTLSPFAFSWELGTIKLSGKRRLMLRIARFLVQHGYVFEGGAPVDLRNLDQDYPRSSSFGGQQVSFRLLGPYHTAPACLACPSYLACALERG